MIGTPQVTVLMPTRNGSRFIEAQLRSLGALWGADWQLWASDDGSVDGTKEKLVASAKDLPIRVFDGPCRGLCANVYSMLSNPDLPDGPIAFCDQDDVWYPGRLARALSWLDRCTGPALYCSRTDIGKSPEQVTRQSPLWPNPPSFRNALIQSIAGANTMVLNAEGAALARQAANGPLPAFHDWWLYMLFSGSGSQILFDPQPSLFYRQHDENTLGRNRGMAARYARFSSIYDGTYSKWVTAQTKAIQAHRALLTDDAKSVLDSFVKMREMRGPRALQAWRRMGVKRHSKLETAAMATAAALGRL